MHLNIYICTSVNILCISFQFEPIVNDNQLLKYVVKDQLLPEFGGTFQYDHENWMTFHEVMVT